MKAWIENSDNLPELVGIVVLILLLLLAFFLKKNRADQIMANKRNLYLSRSFVPRMYVADEDRYSIQNRYNSIENRFGSDSMDYGCNPGKECYCISDCFRHELLCWDCPNRDEFAKDLPAYQENLVKFEQVCGKAHPYIRGALLDLAERYYRLGNYAEAEPLYKRLWEISEKTWIKNNYDIYKDMDNLADVYDALGKRAEASVLWEKSRAIKAMIEKNQKPCVKEPRHWAGF